MTPRAQIEWQAVHNTIQHLNKHLVIDVVAPGVRAGLTTLRKAQQAEVPARWEQAKDSIGSMVRRGRGSTKGQIVKGKAGGAVGIGKTSVKMAKILAKRAMRKYAQGGGNPREYGIVPQTIHWFIEGPIHRDRFQNVDKHRGKGKKTRWAVRRNKAGRIVWYAPRPIPDARNFDKFVGRMGTNIPLMDPIRRAESKAAKLVLMKLRAKAWQQMQKMIAQGKQVRR